MPTAPPDPQLQRIQGAVVALALLLVLITATLAWQHASAEWRTHRQAARDHGLIAAPQVDTIIENPSQHGHPDRCATCHVAAHRTILRDPLPQPLRAHPNQLNAHLQHDLGCADCHGGNPRALMSEPAHRTYGTTRREARLSAPNVYASCLRCHPPGHDPASADLARGALDFLDLGCAVCHPAANSPAFATGPNLRELGQVSLDHLQKSLIQPAFDAPQTTMPSFAFLFDHEPQRATRLLTYLLGLTLPQRAHLSHRAAPDVSTCTHCHARGTPPPRHTTFRHRCPYLAHYRDQLSCQSCHASTLSTETTACPILSNHGRACGHCHLDTSQRHPQSPPYRLFNTHP